MNKTTVQQNVQSTGKRQNLLLFQPVLNKLVGVSLASKNLDSIWLKTDFFVDQPTHHGQSAIALHFQPLPSRYHPKHLY